MTTLLQLGVYSHFLRKKTGNPQGTNREPTGNQQGTNREPTGTQQGTNQKGVKMKSEG